MHPAYSVIVFTVLSGAGFGLLALLGLAPLFGIAPMGAFGWAGFIIAFGLSVGGLLSSTLHLGHPERSLKAFSQWRSSWLSREGVLAVAALLVGGLYAVLALFFGSAPWLLGLLTAVLAIGTVFATAMIYAQLKTVQRWNTPLTALCYLDFALSSGLLLMCALLAMTRSAPTPLIVLTLVMIVLAWLAKFIWWRRGDSAAPLSTPESATGLGHMGTVRMFESPHSGENYLMREMGFQVARKHAAKLRMIALILGGVIPALLVLVALAVSGAGGVALLALAALCHIAGLLVERWLFFGEAKHAVMNFYDRG